MVRIHFNDTALRHIAQHRAADREGRLLHRASKGSYRERWFRLCGNLLFYFRTNDVGAVVDMSDPVGVLVLAACHVQMEEFGDRPFVFSVTFIGEDGRKHFFSGQSQQQCQQWVEVLRACGYSELRTRLESLRRQVIDISGTDPLSAKFKIPSMSGVSQSVGSAATFYSGLSSAKQMSCTFPTTIPLVPTRQAPSRPAQHRQPLVQLLEPSADTELAQVHTATTKATTFADWETFHWVHISSLCTFTV